MFETGFSGVTGLLRFYRWGRNVAAAMLLIGACLSTTAPAWSQSDDAAAERKWGLLLFGGQMSNYAFGRTLNPSVSSNRLEIYFTGAALSRILYSNTYINIEAEGGLGYQYSSAISGNNSPQVWGALYLRYKYFPWNKFIYTTVAINTGLNYSFKKTAYETGQDANDGTSNLLHYLAPEITFSLPKRRDWELVFRLHHRSGIYGALGCDTCGSNMVTFGVRKRF
jgi:hypothetical protein